MFSSLTEYTITLYSPILVSLQLSLVGLGPLGVYLVILVANNPFGPARQRISAGVSGIPILYDPDIKHDGELDLSVPL